MIDIRKGHWFYQCPRPGATHPGVTEQVGALEQILSPNTGLRETGGRILVSINVNAIPCVAAGIGIAVVNIEIVTGGILVLYQRRRAGSRRTVWRTSPGDRRRDRCKCG